MNKFCFNKITKIIQHAIQQTVKNGSINCFQRGNLFVENAYIDFGSLPQRGNLITLQIIMKQTGCSAGARITFCMSLSTNSLRRWRKKHSLAEALRINQRLAPTRL